MAIDLCSDNSSMSMSPRLSFSHDLSLTDILPVEHRPFRSTSTGHSSSFDFDFIPLDQEPSSADEIFSDGKILPIEIVKRKPAESSSLVPDDDHQKPKGIKKQDSSGSSSGSGSKSFWRFKRSTSLNCEGGHGRNLGICPLPLLSRSKSTGSAPDAENPAFSSHDRHPNIKRQSLRNANNHSSSSLKPSQATSAAASSFTGSYQKPPLRKMNAGMKVTPVLNVASGNMFGLGSVFFTGKEKARRK